MSEPAKPAAPQRIALGNAPTAELLASAERAMAPPPGARDRVWRTLQAAEARPAHGARWAVGFSAAAAAAVLAVVLVRRPATDDGAAPASFAEIAGRVEITSEQGASSFGIVGAALPPGAGLEVAAGEAVVRVGQARAALSVGSRVALGARGASASLTVERGAVGVLATSSSRSITVVAAGPYLIEASSALFVVRAEARRVTVHVQRGEVKVRTAAGDVPVSAGGAWASEGTAPAEGEADRRLSSQAAGEAVAAASVRASADPAPAAPAPLPAATPSPLAPPAASAQATAAQPSTPSTAATSAEQRKPSRRVRLARAKTADAPLPPPPPPAPATALAESDEALHARAHQAERQGQVADAAALYEELAGRPGPRAETALYELARLRQRFLGQPAAALDALSEYQRRFPHGSLAPEAALTALDARLSLGGGEPARRAMDAFLDRFPANERAPDVRWLRASLFVDRGDCAAAAADLGALAAAGPRAADAVFAQASCARAAGDLESARARLDEYLRRFPAGSRRAEAERALAGAPEEKP